MGGLYGNIFKDNKKIYIEEISQLVYLSLVKKYGKDFPLKYMQESLNNAVDKFIKFDTNKIFSEILENLKKKDMGNKDYIKNLYKDWDSLSEKNKNEIFDKLKKIKQPDIRLIGSNIDSAQLEKII
ncbi:hypothetical protein PJV93_04710 [Aliarcobacter butzleri]|uniref:Uncharacterized protein n=1 Tax=Aliarcobacter butzleri TaxID=28197 RepID=A0AAW7QBB5_9BACT|nr:hypothetical protein [Aliarcobacter butzleri]MDN5106483.1 hypothetical protein [Aliarcobacter butzleri]MDN5123205.1 hypothetical protein [Aliarcobacter butzleri]